MKNLLITFCLLTWYSMSGFSQTDYNQWEVASYTPKLGMRDMLEKGLAAHNKKFHTANPYKIGVMRTISGPGTGDYTLVMGPVTLSQIDGRPSGAEHDADWQKNVIPYVEAVSDAAFWREYKEVTYAPAGSMNFTKSRLRFFTLNPGQMDRMKAALKLISEVYKAKNIQASYTVYIRYGASQGPHIAAEIGMANWSFLDEPNTFQKDFEEVHGVGSYQKFLDELEIALDRTKTYDVLNVFKPELGSD
ncbi:MAG: hypothetical protein WBP41_14955 [Saprospiraceae bacterium]